MIRTRPATRRTILGGLGGLMVGSSAIAGEVSPARRLRFSDPRTAWRPFELSADQFLRLQVEVNGVAASAVLDSGATLTVLDQGFADRLGLELRGGFAAEGLTGVISGARADGLDIAAAGLEIGGVDAAVLDLSTFAAAARRPVDLVLGQELFEHARVDLDFVGRRLRLRAPDLSGAEVRERGARLPLRRTGSGLRAIPVSLEGRAPVEAIFDLGANAPVFLSPDYAARTGLLHGKRVSTAASAGVEGIEVSRIATIHRMRLGDVELEQVPAAAPASWRPDRPVLVGLPVLSRFRMTIDFGRNHLWLHGEPSLVREPFPKDRSGISALPMEDRLRVIHVAENSPADRIGLRPGDDIVAVNGRRVDGAYLRESPREGAKPAGTVSELTLGSGQVRMMVLADHY